MLRGAWTVSQLARPGVWRATGRALQQAAPDRDGLTWDLRGLDAFDHLGAQRLWDHWGGAWPAHWLAEAPQHALLARVAEFGHLPETARTPGPFRRLTALGEGGIAAWRHARDFIALLGATFLDALRWLRRPAAGPWRDFSGQLYHAGATALPITAMVGFLIGVVLAYLLAQQLQAFGADLFIVNILGVSLVRELGPVLAAILIAGRSGSAITAQIGVMRVTEEIDAMRVLGIAPGFRLVLPRAAALALVMPLLTVWTTLAALLGGLVVSDLTLGLGASYFVHELPKAVPVVHLALALGKSAVFGALIALIGCHFGLRVRPDTQSLGQGTTASVVAAIAMVILVDALFAIVFQGVGT